MQPDSEASRNGPSEDDPGPPPTLPGSEDQPALFDVKPDWEDAWRGMPDYNQEDLMPWQTVMVHFTGPEDREAFAKLVGQHVHSNTKFIWYPKAEIDRAADKIYTNGRKMKPRYPVYIISKGRWESRLTSKAFEWLKIPYHIVIEKQEYEQYAAVIDPAKILVLPFSNLGQGGIPARNWVWEHAKATGAFRHWIFDDNIDGFCRFHDNMKIEVDSGVLHCAIEDFTDRYENVAMSGFNYDYFAPRKQGANIRPFTLNTRIYSGILIRNDLPHRWRGRYNEDTDLSLRVLKDGWCTILFNAFLMYKRPTLTMKGGNSDELYKGDGRRAMAESLREQHPDCVTVEWKWDRWQHQVDYRQFEKNELKLKPDAVIPDVDPYGLTLAPMPSDAEVGYVREKRNGNGAQRSTITRPERERRERPEEVILPPSPVGALDFILQSCEPDPPPPPPPPPPPAPIVVEQTPPPAPSELELPKPPPLFDAPAFRDALLARGHHLLLKEGKFFVSNASQLTPEDRDTIKRHREVIVALAQPWVEGEALAEPPRPEAAVTGPTFESPTIQVGQSLAQFLGSTSERNVDGWAPDEIPDLTHADDLILNFATDGLDWVRDAMPVGVTVATMDGQLSRFLPFAFKAGGNLQPEHVFEFLMSLRNKKITNANTRFDLHVASNAGIDFESQGCRFSDIQHTAALLDDHRKHFALDVLAADYLPDVPKVARVDERQHSHYHASEVAEREHFTVSLVRQLHDVMYPKLVEEDLMAVQTLEDDVIPAVVEMEKNGAPLDLPLLEEYDRECVRRHDALVMEISEEVGFPFDHTPTSWKRLFEKLQLPESESYAEDVLSRIDHPWVKKGFLASQYASLRSKTFKAYKENVDANGVLHFSINQLRGDDGGTVSGRFSIGLVQQVPNKDNHSKVFGDELFPRRLFIPDRVACPEALYLEGDAMQIEYRLLAHYADNKAILAEYAADPLRSFHKMTWERMKVYKADMLYTDQKSFNFARQYGAKSIKLAVMMEHITEEEGEEIRAAKRWNDPRLAVVQEIEAAYRKMMPEGDMLLDYASHLAKPECDRWCRTNDRLHKLYKHRGYVKTLVGRRSRFHNNHKTYIGLNRVIQGGGADIMKRKLALLHAERKHTGLLMRLTIHDSIGGDAREKETQERVREILNAQSFPELKVPILWDVNVGENWAACK